MSFCWVFAAFSPGEVLLEPRSLLLMSRDAYELYVHRIDHVEVHIQDSQWKIPIVNALQLGQVDITRHGIRSYAFLLIRLLYPGDGSKIR